MEKGRIIYLNGVTSAGKTSIVEALQARDDYFFYVVANDLFEEMVGVKYLQQNYWKHLSEVIILMYHTAKLFSDMGKNVIIDGMLVEREEVKPHYEQVLEIFKDNPLDIVEVYCPLEICRQRNIARGNRGEMQSHDQYRYMNQDVVHSIRVDTSLHSPAECAEIITAALFGT
ncbi:MAG: AAA family ATPase [Clostridia bacterium]|nr:AAA family ATPase [Clostridia bacterium]MBQ8383603.1 AAA family ATPase [Clostridia bacterium]